MTLPRVRKKPTTTINKTTTTATSSPVQRNLRLVCSFNGAFQPKHPSNKLRYTGGETRVISVDKNIGFLKLCSKISDLCPKFRSFTINYQLPTTTSGAAEIRVLKSDDDVRCMVEEYHKIEMSGKKNNIRLWLFVCSNSDFDDDNRVFNGKKNDDFDLISFGYDDNCVSGFSRESCDDDDCKGGKNLVNEAKNVNQSVGVNCSYSDCVDDHPLIDLGTEVKMSQNDPFDYRSRHEQSVVGSENYSGLVHLVGPKVHTNDGNLRLETNGSFLCFMGLSRTRSVNSNTKNITPTLSGCVYPITLARNVARNHKFGVNVNDDRNHRIHPYYIKNHPNNSVKARNQHTARLDGARKCYRRSNFKLMKQVPYGRLYDHLSSRNPRPVFFGNSLEQTVGRNNTCIGNPCTSTIDNCYTSQSEMPQSHYQSQLHIFHEGPTNSYARNLQNRIESSVELLDNLSLSSFASTNTKPLDHMDDGLLNTGEESLRKECVRQEEIQEDPPSTLCLNEKADDEESYRDSSIIGTISSSLTAFCAGLATRELQTIKSLDLEYVKELGSGTYGMVFHGKWKGSDVAIKRLKPSCFAEGSKEQDRLVADFWKEAHMLGQLHHPNIMAFYGVVSDGPVTNLATVTEYLVNGSLKQVLKRKDRTIDRRKRLILAMGAAFGMEYLHEKNIVHFDLKYHNFLVNTRDPHRPICKIGDLGLSKIKQRTLVSGGVRGTIPWMAPELLNSKNMVTEKVDVYSFGIVLWELLTGEEPYANMRSEEIIAGITKGSLRPEIPTWCDPAWGSLMESCWSSDPKSRPSFSEIAKELRLMSAPMNIK